MISKAFEILTDTIASLKTKARLDIVEDTPLESLELDSLEQFELVMTLEEKLGFELDLAQLSSCRTFGDLSALIDRELQQR